MGVYSGEEVQSGIKELFTNDKFVAGMKAFLPTKLSQKFIDHRSSFRSCFEFQKELVHPLLTHVLKESSNGLSSKGISKLEDDKKYLFISNHRDISLDPAFVNYVLFNEKHETVQIAIGDNLMKHRVAELIFKINKSFVVQRAGSPRELYKASVDLSQYISDTINQKTDSVWLAQREGRAKDGNDRTQPGLIKMLTLCDSKNIIEHLSNLNIVPVALTYEYDPCDHFKTQEFINRKFNPDYQKSFDEDIKSLLQGMTGNKGKISVNFGTPISTAIQNIEETQSKVIIEKVVQMIDNQVHQLYELNPINYVAHDLLNGKEVESDHYTLAEKKNIELYLNKRLTSYPDDRKEIARDYLLNIYANPLINKLSN